MQVGMKHAEKGIAVIRNIRGKINWVTWKARRGVDRVEKGIDSAYRSLTKPLDGAEERLKQILLEEQWRQRPLPVTVEECTVERLEALLQEVNVGPYFNRNKAFLDALDAVRKRYGSERRGELARQVYRIAADTWDPGECGWGD